jgi:hypothetical protein
MRPSIPLAALLALAIAVVTACGGTATATSPAVTVAPGSLPPSVVPASPTPAVESEAPTPAPESPTPPAFPTGLVLGQTFALFYDPALERVVLVNGAGETGPPRPTELWSWTGSTWELLDAAGPLARSFGAVGRDPERGVLVVHGGIVSASEPFAETLEWDGRDWTVHQGAGAGPGPREGAGLAWDARSSRMLLFGGAVGSEQLGDTWAWDGATWTQVADSGPRPRFVSLMTEDRDTGDILLQGGHWVDGNEGDFLADTWRWDGDAWVEVTADVGPGPRVNSPGAWDERLGGIVLFGGGTGLDTPFAADTWLWTGAWAEVGAAAAPSARNGHAMAFDAKRGVLVLVGGIDRPGGAQALDVWELDANGWREVAL